MRLFVTNALLVAMSSGTVGAVRNAELIFSNTLPRSSHRNGPKQTLSMIELKGDLH
jgi:hypothetical protein